MPFRQSWYIQDHVVKVEFWGSLTIEDLIKSFDVSGKFLIESHAPRIHFIYDWSELEHFPTNFKEIRQGIDFNQNPAFGKLGLVVIISTKQYPLKAVGDLIFQIFQIRTYTTDTLESALIYLQQRDSFLKPLLHQKILSHVRWHLKGHVLYCHHADTADDIMIRNQNALNLIQTDGKLPAVHMLIDFSLTEDADYTKDIRELLRFSTSSPEFQKARDALIRHPLFGWVVVFGIKSENVNMGGKIVAQKFSYKRKDVDTIDDAMAFLKQIDSNVAHLLGKQVDSQ